MHHEAHGDARDQGLRQCVSVFDDKALIQTLDTNMRLLGGPGLDERVQWHRVEIEVEVRKAETEEGNEPDIILGGNESPEVCYSLSPRLGARHLITAKQAESIVQPHFNTGCYYTKAPASGPI